MPQWARELVEAIDSRKQNGGVQNVMQPGRLVSASPPVVEVCGVQIQKRLHVNPAMRSEPDLAGITAAMGDITAAFEELEAVKDAEPPEIVEAVKALAAPVTAGFDAILAVLQKGLVQDGDQVMVRQDGNDIHVMGGTGGGRPQGGGSG